MSELDGPLSDEEREARLRAQYEAQQLAPPAPPPLPDTSNWTPGANQSVAPPAPPNDTPVPAPPAAGDFANKSFSATPATITAQDEWRKREIERRAAAKVEGPQGLDYLGEVATALNPFSGRSANFGESPQDARYHAEQEVANEGKAGVLHSTAKSDWSANVDPPPPGTPGVPTQKPVESAAHHANAGSSQHTEQQAQAISPGIFVPPHAVPRVSPQVAGTIAAGETLQAHGADEQKAAEVKANDAMARFKAQAAEDARVREMLDNQWREEKNQAMNDHLAQIQAKADSLAAQKIDPKDYAKHLGIGEKILGVVAMALGGFVQGFRGGDNPAEKIINGEINRNIEAQVQNLAHGRAGLATDQSLYAQKLKLFGDEDAAKRAARQEQLASTVMAGDAFAAKYNSPVISARWDQTRGQFIREFGHEQSTLEQWSNGGWQGGAANGGIQVSDATSDEVLPVFGRKYYIKDDKAREAMRQASDNAAIVNRQADVLKRLLETPWNARGPAWYASAKAAKKELVGHMTKDLGGRGGPAAFKIVESALDHETVVDIRPAIDVLVRGANGNVMETLRSSNAHNVTEVKGYIDPKSKLERVAYVMGDPYVAPEESGGKVPGTQTVPGGATVTTPPKSKPQEEKIIQLPNSSVAAPSAQAAGKKGAKLNSGIDTAKNPKGLPPDSMGTRR